jgi:hypothetical protein
MALTAFCSRRLVERLRLIEYLLLAISESLIWKSDDRNAGPNFKLMIWELDLKQLATLFPLSWTHCVQLMRRTRTTDEHTFYETEALRGGWSVRQLTGKSVPSFTRAPCCRKKSEQC